MGTTVKYYPIMKGYELYVNVHVDFNGEVEYKGFKFRTVEVCVPKHVADDKMKLADELEKEMENMIIEKKVA